MSVFFSKLKTKCAPPHPGVDLKKMPGGFTLIEVLASVVLLAFGLGAILSLQAATMRGGSTATSSTMATFLAESQSEYLRTISQNELNLISQDPEELSYSGLPCNPTATPPVPCYFTRTTTINFGYPLTNSYTISIQMQWNNDQNILIYDTVVPNTSFN